PARRGRLRATQTLHGALLQLATEPHALLRGGRGQLHELAKHALVGVRPRAHRLDHPAGQLPEHLFRFSRLVHLIPPAMCLASSCCRLVTSDSPPSITRSVMASINICASRYRPYATVAYPFQIDALDGGSLCPPTPSLGCSGTESSAAVTARRSSSSTAPTGRRSRGARSATSSGRPRSA